MNDTAQIEAKQLTELLTQQRDVYRRLRELAMAQRASIEDEEPESLLRILADRQRQIARLTELNSQLEPHRSRWDQIRQSLAQPERLRVGELVEEVQQLLAEILQRDEGDCDALRQRSSETQGGAAAAALGQKVNAAYAAQGYAGSSPRYIDRSDEGGTAR